MKRLLALLAALISAFAVACGNNPAEESAKPESAESSEYSLCESKPTEEESFESGLESDSEASLSPQVPSVEYTLLGNPYSESYEKFPNSNAHLPWDLALFDNKLFVGSGDYSANSGPTPMKHLDFETDSWVDNGTLPDEAITGFAFLGETLVATGTDPQGSWSTGNYYLWDQEKWQVKRVLPKLLHNFDLAEYQGLIFAAGGALNTDNMVCVSSDGGKTFKSVPFHCETEITDNLQKRVYHLFVLDQRLFAILADCSVYEYTEQGFVFVTHWKGNASFRSKVVADDALYFASTYFFRVENVEKGEQIELGDWGTVYDVCQFGGRVYATASKKLENGGYLVSVFGGTGSEFTRLFEFEYPQPAFSMAVEINRFCFGMGDYSGENTPHESCGDILLVEFEK